MEALSKDRQRDPATAGQLPINKAFVLQLTSETGETLRTFAGRVEHLPSGRRLRFDGMKEFLAALSQLLKETNNR